MHYHLNFDSLLAKDAPCWTASSKEQMDNVNLLVPMRDKLGLMCPIQAYNTSIVYNYNYNYIYNYNYNYNYKLLFETISVTICKVTVKLLAD